MLPSGVRAGFFIGDGAGVGKGRQISGIVCDNYCRGRTKHVWVSTSTDLHADAVRDLRDLGMQLPVINNCAALDAANKAGGLSKDFQHGVLFLTYSTLVSAGRGATTRFEQVMKWLGGPDFDGCLIFDECHRYVASSCRLSVELSKCICQASDFIAFYLCFRLLVLEVNAYMHTDALSTHVEFCSCVWSDI
jgi:hypothetical protein